MTMRYGTTTIDELIDGVRAGHKRAVAKAISLIEDEDPRMEEIMRHLFPYTGHAYVVGFTGPPGSGKSSLVDGVVQLLRTLEKRVAVIAVDPNSPFSGGAILGDRIRMMRHAVDRGVFIRSMGARGHLGGLSLATARAVHVLDASGVDYVLLETVGVGQSELEVAETADTTVVVLMPGLGDSVQTIKAGIMEIADIFVVNKADHPSVQKTVADLRELLRLDVRPRKWIPPIVKTVATREEGIADLWNAISKHQQFLEETSELEERRRVRLERQIVDLALRRLREHVLKPSIETPAFRDAVRRVLDRQLDPYTAAAQLSSKLHIPTFKNGSEAEPWNVEVGTKAEV
jgi:LAO/AO transport system kinase